MVYVNFPSSLQVKVVFRFRIVVISSPEFMMLQFHYNWVGLILDFLLLALLLI